MVQSEVNDGSIEQRYELECSQTDASERILMSIKFFKLLT